MTPAEHRALMIWQSHRHLSPIDRIELIDCDACGGTGKVVKVDRHGNEQGEADCSECDGFGSRTLAAVGEAVSEQ